MNTTFSLILLVFITTAPAFAQTKMVAHRSHGGSIETFSVNGAGNFGETEEMRRRSRVTKVIRISDSSAIEVFDGGQDTVYNHYHWNNPKIRLDSLKKMYPDMSFEGFEQEQPVTQGRLRGNMPHYTYPGSGVREPDHHGVMTLSLISAAAAVVVAGGIWRSRKRGAKS